MTAEVGLLVAGILGAGIVLLIVQVRGLSARLDHLSLQMEQRASSEPYGGEPSVRRAQKLLQDFRARTGMAERPGCAAPPPERPGGT
jgi:hypothetical protein